MGAVSNTSSSTVLPPIQGVFSAVNGFFLWLYLYLGRVCERGQKNVPPMSARRRGDLGGAELEHQELLELPRRRRTAARTRQTGSTGRARGAAAPQGRPAAPATAPRRRAPATQHSTAASWASPTAEGACRAGTRPRACGVASRTPAHPVVTARRQRSPTQCQRVAHAAFP